MRKNKSNFFPSISFWDNSSTTSNNEKINKTNNNIAIIRNNYKYIHPIHNPIFNPNKTIPNIKQNLDLSFDLIHSKKGNKIKQQ